MINGLIQPTSGHVKVHGQDIQEQDLIQLRRHMGYVIQGSVLFPSFNSQTKYCLCFTIRKENKKYGSNRRSMVRNSTIRFKL